MIKAGSHDVSIIIAAWNAERFIHTAIESALAQTGITLEVIVADDASDDATSEVVERIKARDDRVRYVRLDVNSGPSGARNRAMALASGRYLAVLDADDTMLPGRLEKLVTLGDATGADIIADNMRKLLPPATIPEPAPFLTLPDLPDPYPVSLVTYMDPDTDTRLGGGLGYLKPLFRQASVQRLGMSYDLSLRNSEDYYFVVRMLAEGARMLIMHYAGYIYTIREGSISHRLSSEMTSLLLTAEQEFTDQYGAAFGAAERRAARRRLKLLRKRDAMARFVEAVKRRKILAALYVFVSQPVTSPHIISELVRIAGERLGRTGMSQAIKSK